ncbi:kelch repeat-containing protein [Stigmatella aurantiaca]|uniref:kelch repeat-containing protein n=1 Tax=Stigmatella aurantiaca TaxID=41 RepID=UPI0002E103EE|nr:kelch repeat-containing protein [Stigmatella aurantiaca]
MSAVWALSATGCGPSSAGVSSLPEAPLSQAAALAPEFVTVLEPEADAKVTTGIFEENTNFGADNHFKVSVWFQTDSYLRFNLGSLPTGAKIRSVKLMATAFQGYSASGDGNVYTYLVPDNTWGEYTLTWNTRPPPTGGPLGWWFLWYPSSSWIEDKLGVNEDPSLIPVVQSAANAADRRISLMLRNHGYYDTTYHSREVADATKRPKLEVHYTQGDVWKSASPLPSGRTKHSATLLADGRVLVAGGASSAGWTDSAALYSPATGTWAATASMSVKRYGHGSNLLNSGEVFVTGGQNNGVTLASTERYDATSGTWSAAASMAVARFRHTVTVLNDGRLLVAGGVDGTMGLTSTELYNPLLGTWAPGPSMSTRRYGHTATLLPDGRVLVAGGHTGGQALATAEVYNPATNSWTGTGTMGSRHYGHAAALLPDGRVLAVSGLTPSGVHTPITELYDPTTGVWTATGSLATARSEFSLAALPSGRVLVLGGTDGTAITPTVESYNVATGTWTQAPAMGTARRNLTATVLLEGRILVSGGQEDASTVSLASSELFTPDADL